MSAEFLTYRFSLCCGKQSRESIDEAKENQQNGIIFSFAFCIVQLSQSSNETFIKMNKDSTPQNVKTFYSAVCVCVFSIDNLIRWITLSILTFGVHIKKNAQPECLPHITWNFIWEWNFYPPQQLSSLRLFYMIAERKRNTKQK